MTSPTAASGLVAAPQRFTDIESLVTGVVGDTPPGIWVIITCSDPRLGDFRRKLEQVMGRATNHEPYPDYSQGGGLRFALAGTATEQLDWLTVPFDAASKPPAGILVIEHTDCGGYRQAFGAASPEVELARHLGYLVNTRRNLRQHAASYGHAPMIVGAVIQTEEPGLPTDVYFRDPPS